MNKLIVLTGKTASGKDTVMSKVLSRFPDLKRAISSTSRKQRQGEKNGVDYFFLSKEEFKKKIEKGDFVEYVEYGGNLYGTEKRQLASSHDLIWRIDPSRAGKIRDLIKDKNILVVYLTVDDATVLERLAKRSFPQEEINRRMQEDQFFWEQYKNNYDFVVENVPGNLNETINQVCNLIKK